MFDELLETFATEVGRFFDTPIVRLALQAIALYIVLLWAVTAFWAYRDLQTRTTNPVAPYLAAALIILFTPLLFVFGVVIYRILRPNETVAEANERALAEEAMMVEIEAQPHCANCSRQVHEDWIICPTCRNRLRRVCPNCSRLVELDWSLCAWCGKDFERPELLQEVAVPPPVGRPLKAPDNESLPAEASGAPMISSSPLDARAAEPRPQSASGER
ncbi:MAG TPA: zinc ribbon domain-containing protein [Candidatus Limnocylindria bacterium]|nr:zinc ribbon domain-containing protein [Candidatus Limnocylindria bacterium]